MMNTERACSAIAACYDACLLAGKLMFRDTKTVTRYRSILDSPSREMYETLEWMEVMSIGEPRPKSPFGIMKMM